MKPSEHYKQHCKRHKLRHDPVQLQVIQHCDTLHTQLSTTLKPRHISPWLRLFSSKPIWPLQSGLYLWGGVGRGKTMIMDIFYNSLETSYKTRLHFHHFMQIVHQQLRQHENTRDPLETIAVNIAKQYRILCLDEFHVSDVVDAMILAGLLNALFKQGIILLTTSNRKPVDLYLYGLQRDRFLAAINLLNIHTTVINLDNQTDYRLLTLAKADTYYFPLNEENTRHLQALFTKLTGNSASITDQETDQITINNRHIPVLCQTSGTVCFEFNTLCNTPRSRMDYLEIARQYHTVFICNIRIMDNSKNDLAKRFTYMLDVFYDYRVKLIISAETTADKLYTGNLLAFGFKRVISRLAEMQSEEYLSEEHRPQ